MPFVPKRPPALEHLSSAAASAVLAKHFGDIVKAAKELGVDRKDLLRLTWHNPRILKAAHERMELFRIGVRSKILQAVYSGSAKRRRWGYDALCDSYEFRDHLSGVALLAPAPRLRVEGAGSDLVALEKEAAAERELERAAEFERDREGEEMVVEIEPLRAPGPVSEEPSSAAPAESELPIWPGQYSPPPLIAHLYRLWTPLRQEPCRRVARSG